MKYNFVNDSCRLSIKLLSIFFFFIAMLQLKALTDNIIPKANGTWIYDGTYSDTGTKGPVQPGLFIQDLKSYNERAKPGHELSEVFVYGGDMEGPGKSDYENDPSCLNDANWNSVYYYSVEYFGKKKTWSNYDLLKSGTGFETAQAYTPMQQFMGNDGYMVTDSTGIPKVHYKILVIDGRVDGSGYVQGLNAMSKKQASAFADKVARAVCADQSIDGVQFDIEPFSFTGEGGVLAGNGQKYFYQEIAKDFAGWYGHDYDAVSGINPDSKTDLLHAVSIKHPYGRFFSVFTFHENVTDDVIDLCKKFGNFYIVDSLYDLDHRSGSGGTNTDVQGYKKLVTAEVKKMQGKGVPYQFGIPAAASCHEFEYCNGVSSGQKQLDYVKAAIAAINNPKLNIRNDPNFKGVDLWAWNSAMWWHGMKFKPAKPPVDVISYLQNNL